MTSLILTLYRGHPRGHLRVNPGTGLMRVLRCGDRSLDLSECRIMGVINLTRDSFSDAGELYGSSGLDPQLVLARARKHLQEGASVLDLGAQSTRPGAEPVALATELECVVEAVQLLVRECDAVISVDTSRPQVMRAALAAGAHMINDVMALRQPGALEAVAQTQCGLCLMHMQGTPATMQRRPSYSDVTGEVVEFLRARVQACRAVGIADERLLLDPGFGFGKTLAHNLTLLGGLRELALDGLPVAVGLSRKSMLGALTDRAVGERMVAGAVAAAVAVERGAALVRTHDVAATADALKVVSAVKRQLPDGGEYAEIQG